MNNKIEIQDMSHPNRIKMLVLPDIHFNDHDERSLEIIKHILKTDKFDEIVQLGDLLDMYSMSSFSKSPEKFAEGIISELDEARKFLGEVRKLQPKAKITVLKGNHEARWERYIIDKAPGLHNLFDYRELLGVKELNINYVDDIYKVGKLHFLHGKYVRGHSAYSAKAHFDKMNVSLIHGHTHRMGTYYKTTLDTTYSVHEMGCLVKFYPEYAQKIGCTDWQQGFGVVYIDKRSGWYFVVPFPIVNHICIYKGKVIKG